MKNIEKRSLTLPLDLVQALRQREGARDAFDKLSNSHQKEYVAWIESAVKAETRQARIARMIEMLLHNQAPTGKTV